MVKFKYAALGMAGMAVLLLFNTCKVNAQDITWKLDNLNSIGNAKPEVLGTPLIKNDEGHKAIAFNGVGDALVMPKVPIEGWKHFTIEVLFKPDGDGPVEPRFIHFQDKDENRGTFEIRLNKQKQWFLDVFLKNAKVDDKGLALNDPSLLHPADRWYWVAMVFDGKNMSGYVNGVKEKEGISNFPTLGSAQIALGMRLNKVSWFKGEISEIRFHPAVLDPAALQRVKE